MPQQHEIRTLLARHGFPHASERTRGPGPDRWAPWLSPPSLWRLGHDADIHRPAGTAVRAPQPDRPQSRRAESGAAADLDARLSRATTGPLPFVHCVLRLPGSGALRHIVGAPALTVDRAYRAQGAPKSDAVSRDYLFGLAGMPDEFCAVGGDAEVLTGGERIVSALGDGCTPREIAAGTTGDRLAAELVAALVAEVLTGPPACSPSGDRPPWCTTPRRAGRPTGRGRMVR